MRAFGFPKYMLSEFRAGVQCNGCKRSGQILTVKPPLIHQDGVYIQFVYPYRCPCGATGSFKVDIPFLLFAFVLARLAVVDLQKHRRKATALVPMGQCGSFEMYIREFEKSLYQHAMTLFTDDPAAPNRGDLESPPAPSPNALDRLRLRMSESEFSKFVKRLGFPPPDEVGDKPPF